MTSVLLCGTAIADSTARRAGIVHNNTTGGWNSGTASFRDQLISSAGTMQNMRVLLTVAPGVGTSYVFTLYKNGSATALTVTISGTATTGSDTTHTVTVAAGDALRWEYTVTGTPATTRPSLSVEYVGDTTNESQILGSNPDTSLSGGATTQYLPLSGTGLPTTVEQSSRQLIATSGTIKKMYVNADGAPGAAKTITFTLMVNGSATALTCNMSGAAATTANDTSNTVSVSAGDTVSMRVSYSGAAIGTSFINFGVTFLASTANEFPIIAGTSADPSTSATNYCDLVASDNESFSATENQRQAVGSVWYVKNMYSKVTTAPGAGKSWALKLRQNAADTALTNTISDANTTANATTTITLALYDALSVSFTPSGTPTSSAEIYWAFTGTFVTPTVATMVPNSMIM